MVPGNKHREEKKVSQVIFARCTASEGTVSRPEWGQFPCPQVEHLPPCSTKSRRNLPLPLTTSAPLQGGRPSLRFPGNNRFTPIRSNPPPWSRTPESSL